MSNRFWRGLLWGGVAGALLGAMISPMARPRKKPLVRRSVETIRDTAHNLMDEAYHARKRLMKRMS